MCIRDRLRRKREFNLNALPVDSGEKFGFSKRQITISSKLRYKMKMTNSNYLAVFDWNSTLFDDVQAMYQATNACLAVFDIAPMSLAEQQEIFSFPSTAF